jgi:glucose/arabinose dehydrogenase
VPTAAAATLPAGFTETPIASGLSSPTAMAMAPDGRLFVCEQSGTLRVVQDGALLATPFVSLSVNDSGERGLLGVAFDPDFATNHFVYVYYTTSSAPIHNRVSRLTASGDVAAAASETILFDLDNLSSATNHNGGAIHFGPDGKLYAAAGENANSSNSQSFTTVLGKILRLNPNGSTPTDNPFFATTTGKNRAIWARGLRNPFTFTFQPVSGRMFINDVGESTWEEINDGVAGSNYGWPTTEGETANPSFRSPLFVYQHGGSATTGCAITGGAFFDPGADWPAEFQGDYFFADYCSGWIRHYDPATDAASGFASGIASPVDLLFRPEGLYYLARDAGAILRIESTATQAPQITSEPQDVTVSEGRPASFRVGASGAPTLTYQWQRNRVDIDGANGTSTAQLTDDGALFRCVVSNGVGSAQSREATLTVTPNQPPQPTILLPLPATRYKAGDSFVYEGKAADPEDGKLPGRAFTWQIDFHHDAHTHPFLPPTRGSKRGSFTIPTTGETSANVFYRLMLTVTDSGGAASTTSVDLLPKTSTVRIETVPPGLVVNLDGQPMTAPFAFVAVAGMKRTLEAVTPQTLGSVTYNFKAWSDTKPAAHSIKVKTDDKTYTATFKAARP